MVGYVLFVMVFILIVHPRCRVSVSKNIKYILYKDVPISIFLAVGSAAAGSVHVEPYVTAPNVIGPLEQKLAATYIAR